MASSLLSFFPFLLSLVLLPFNIVAKNEECHSVLDVMQIQDVTRSLDHFLPAMKSQVGLIMKKIADTNPEAKFGFASFQDKNIRGVNPSTHEPHTLGEKNNRCARLDAPLGKPNAEKITKIFKKYSARKDGGGADKKQAVFEALYRVLLTPKAGWRSKTKKGRKVAKVAVIVTNGVSHVVGDVPALTGKEVRPFDLTLAGLKKHKYNTNFDCDKVDYPKVEQVVELVKHNHIQVVVLAAPCGKFDIEGQFTPCQDLAALKDHKYHKRDGLAHWYRKQFHDAKLHNVLVYELGSKMENYAEVFSKAIDDVLVKNHEAVEKLQGYIAGLEQRTRDLDEDDYHKLIEEQEKAQETQSVLEQALAVMPEGCLSEKTRHNLHQQAVDGLDAVKSFQQRIELALATWKNEGIGSGNMELLATWLIDWLDEDDEKEKKKT